MVKILPEISLSQFYYCTYREGLLINLPAVYEKPQEGTFDH